MLQCFKRYFSASKHVNFKVCGFLYASDDTHKLLEFEAGTTSKKLATYLISKTFEPERINPNKGPKIILVLCVCQMHNEYVESEYGGHGIGLTRRSPSSRIVAIAGAIALVDLQGLELCN